MQSMLQEQELITQHNIDMNNKLCYFNDVGTASSNLWGGLEVRAYSKEDYPTLVDWWKAWRSPVIPPENLSDIGLIVGEAAACFLYTTNSSLCFLDTCVSDPKAPKRNEAVDLVIDSLTAKARELGYKTIFAIPSIKPLQNRLYNQGWKDMNHNLTQIGGLL